MDLSRLRPEAPTRFTMVVLACSWAAAYLLGDALAGPLLEIAGAVVWVIRVPLLAAALSFLIIFSLRFFILGFFFVWLAEGSWVERAVWAWLSAKVFLALWLAFATRFGLPWRAYVLAPAVSLAWPGVVDLGACLWGARLAEDNLWRPNLQRAREILFQTLGFN